MEIRKLCFSYGDKSFMEGLSADIEKGKITTILGPNGSGKSTLLNLLIKQLKPRSGDIAVDNKSIYSMSVKEIAKHIAMVHQANTAPADITVRRLVEYGRMPHQTMFSSDDKDAKEIVDWALEVTRLTGMADKCVGQLSGGERQRAWIAMALAQKTDILFLDEPTTYLDIRYQLQILKLVKMLNQEYGFTVVMVLHDINQSLYYSDEIVALKNGKVLVQGEPEKVITSETVKQVYDIDLKLSTVDGKPYVIAV